MDTLVPVPVVGISCNRPLGSDRMFVTSRCVAVLGATIVASLGLGACGTGSSGEIVAQVPGLASISKATLEHWMPVEAVVLYQEYPTKPVPNGVIPDPPDYSACIAYLRTHRQLGERTTKQTAAQLKSKCEHQHKELKVLTLNTLLVWYWTIGAGRELGMKASDAEARARLKEVNPIYFSTDAAFKRYLKLTGQTVDDMLFRSRVQLFEAKLLAALHAIEKSLPKGLTAQQRQNALARFASVLPPNRQWAARTTCSNGYVVSACKQYNGPEAPGIPN
jgi:hypothetical protein